jgi:hypothetical protein
LRNSQVASVVILPIKAIRETLVSDRAAEVALYQTGANGNLPGSGSTVLALASVRADEPLYGKGAALSAGQMEDLKATFTSLLPHGAYDTWVATISPSVAEVVG